MRDLLKVLTISACFFASTTAGNCNDISHMNGGSTPAVA